MMLFVALYTLFRFVIQLKDEYCGEGGKAGTSPEPDISG